MLNENIAINYDYRRFVNSIDRCIHLDKSIPHFSQGSEFHRDNTPHYKGGSQIVWGSFLYHTRKLWWLGVRGTVPHKAAYKGSMATKNPLHIWGTQTAFPLGQLWRQGWRPADTETLSQLVVKLKEKEKKAASFDLHDWTATPLQSGVKSITKGKAKLHEYMRTTDVLLVLCCTLNIARVIHLPFLRDSVSPWCRRRFEHCKRDKTYIELRTR